MEPLLLTLILKQFFAVEAPLPSGSRVIAAFSGGPDSAALLWGLAQLAQSEGFAVTAAHLDHGLDSGSAARAEAAGRIAERLGVELVTERREVEALRSPSESLEAAARRIRYGFLEEVREHLGALWVATAHHRDDQAETVALRLLYGSGLAGMAGIRPVHGRVVRPLLAAGRADLRIVLDRAAIVPVEDPTNRDLRRPRNLIRHRLLPALEASTPGLTERLACLAGRARRASAAVDRRLEQKLGLGALSEGGVGIDRSAFAALPEPLRPPALALLHRRAGAPYPAGSEARAELERQLRDPSRRAAGCDCGSGWRWEERGDRLILGRMRERAPDFTYTLEIPGELEISEIAVRVRLSRHPVEPWMFRGAPDRAALVLPLEAGDRVTIRNRRSGDCIQPLGAPGSRRLKEVLIDRRVPKQERDRLPLLCVGERIAWVPGVTIDQRFRLPEMGDTTRRTVWVAEVTR